MVSSGYYMTTALMHSQRLWLVEQDLYQTKPVNSLAEREEGFTSLLTGQQWADDGFWVSFFKAMDPAMLTMLQ